MKAFFFTLLVTIPFFVHFWVKMIIFESVFLRNHLSFFGGFITCVSDMIPPNLSTRSWGTPTGREYR